MTASGPCLTSQLTGRRDAILARLHPGVAAQVYILAHVKHPLGRGVVVPLLTESNLSNRQIAAVAGVSPQTVTNTVRELSTNGQLPDRPTETLGADGKLRPISPLRPRLDAAPYAYSGPRTVTAVVIDTPSKTPFRVIAQTFERDARRLLDAYRTHLDDERFAARFGAVLAAIESALVEEK